MSNLFTRLKKLLSGSGSFKDYTFYSYMSYNTFFKNISFCIFII